MSLLWKTAAKGHPWSDAPDDYLHDGVEEYGDLEVVHPDESPYHNEPLMDTTEMKHERVDPHDEMYAMQAWLEKPILDHFADHPHRIAEVSDRDPLQIVHHEDEGKRYLLNGHHRIVAARALGLHTKLPAEVSYVSRKRIR
jgi:hypothetical protein